MSEQDEVARQRERIRLDELAKRPRITLSRGELGLATTDSPEFATVKLTSLSDGFIPKHTSKAVGLENSVLQQTAEGLVTTAAFNAGSIVRYTPFTYFI